MKGTITIGLDEYEQLKALEGKKLYSGDLSQEDIDRVSKLQGDIICVYETTYTSNMLFPRKHTQIISRDEYIRKINNMLSQLKSRNLWERITRKYE